MRQQWRQNKRVLSPDKYLVNNHVTVLSSFSSFILFLLAGPTVRCSSEGGRGNTEEDLAFCRR